MTISSLQGLEDTLANLARLRLPGTIATQTAKQSTQNSQPSNRHLPTYGISAPVLSFAVFPSDILTELS